MPAKKPTEDILYHEKIEPKLEMISWWYRDGIPVEVIAERLSTSITTLNGYQNRFPKLRKALEQGKEEADLRVQDSLYRRAVGYEYEELVEETETPGRRGSDRTVRRRTLTKKALPDVQAGTFWMRNRQPGRWSKDNKSMEATVKIIYNTEKPNKPKSAGTERSAR
ncbi:hypothetical protein LCGC14_1150690 [marine sediment metagenome]|uniref:Uncharacterized protein n=1 Tax=marine sediment metagenome TaxID=412755 RepID=A0A0F9Q166_9ZZZZ